MRALVLLFGVFVLAIIALYWNDQAKPGRWEEEDVKPRPRKISNARGSLPRRGDAA